MTARPSSRFALAASTLVALIVALALTDGQVRGQENARGILNAILDQVRERFRPTAPVEPEDPTAGVAHNGKEAPAGFDNVTNGFSVQGPDFETLNEDNVVPGRSFNDNRFIFEEVEGADDGLGPTYNAQSCRECHQNVATGGASQVTEHRTGHLTEGQFFESQGGSLIQSRATYPEATEIVAVEDDVRTFRISTNTLGAGYIESIANATLLRIQSQQPSNMGLFRSHG